jgi:NADP-dependent 3-hydroxy acid dehydrogenase YdfG
MVDINIKGVLYGIAAAMAVFRRQSFEHFVNTASTAGLITKPNQAVYSGTKFAVALHLGGLAPRGGDKLRVTIVSPGLIQTNFAESADNPEVRAQIPASMDSLAIPADAGARGIAFAIEQPANVDVGEIVVRPTTHG